MKTSPCLFTVLFIGFTISILACGTESEADEPDQEKTEFPIPWQSGAEVITEEWNGQTGHVTLQYNNSEYESVVDFYDDYATGNGWNRSEIGQGDIPTINYMNLMAGLIISVDPPDDQIPGVFIVTLTVS